MPIDLTLGPTRTSLHSLAEHVLAVDLHRRTGKIGLRRTDGGFGQPEHVVDGVRHRLRLDGSRLVIDDGTCETWHEITTLGGVLDLVGVAPGTMTGVFQPTSPGSVDADLVIDPVAAASIGEWFCFVEAALEEFRRLHRDYRPAVVQLWPEHFDLACSLGETNFGGSPGDEGSAGRDEPYLYVGPWTPPPVGGFWNEPYGAALSRSDVGSVDEAVDFFERGLAAAISST